MDGCVQLDGALEIQAQPASSPARQTLTQPVVAANCFNGSFTRIHVAAANRSCEQATVSEVQKTSMLVVIYTLEGSCSPSPPSDFFSSTVSGLPGWAWLVLGVGALLLIVGIILVAVIFGRRAQHGKATRRKAMELY